MLKKLTMLKVPVVPLNNPVDYGAWHLAFRRLVKGYNMGDALMFTIPEDRVKAFKTRAEITKIKLEEEEPSARPYIQAPIIQPQAPFQAWLRCAVSRRCFSSSETRVSTVTALSSIVNSSAILWYCGVCQAAISSRHCSIHGGNTLT